MNNDVNKTSKFLKRPLSETFGYNVVFAVLLLTLIGFVLCSPAVSARVDCAFEDMKSVKAVTATTGYESSTYQMPIQTAYNCYGFYSEPSHSYYTNRYLQYFSFFARITRTADISRYNLDFTTLDENYSKSFPSALSGGALTNFYSQSALYPMAFVYRPADYDFAINYTFMSGCSDLLNASLLYGKRYFVCGQVGNFNSTAGWRYSFPMLIDSTSNFQIQNSTYLKTYIIPPDTSYPHIEYGNSQFSPNWQVVQLSYGENDGSYFRLMFPCIDNPDTFYSSTYILQSDSFYQLGYNSGYDVGYQAGLTNNSSYDDGYDSGYSVGYNKGHVDGVASANDYSFIGLFGAVFDAPIAAITGLLNWDMFGVNTFSLFTWLITLCIALRVLSLILGKV